MRNIRLDGKYVYLEEVQPKYFHHIIEWRNNPYNNHFLNQPYKLTMELQTKWYEENYLKDMSQGLFVMVDKQTCMPFGTVGWTDYSSDFKVCIGGRLLVGEQKYRGGIQWREATLLFNQFIYLNLNVNMMYAHVVNNNIASIKWHHKWGFMKSKKVYYPEELIKNGMVQYEFYRSYVMYLDHLTRRI